MRRILPLLFLAAALAVSPRAAAATFDVGSIDPALTTPDSSFPPTKASVYPTKINLRGCSGIASMTVTLNTLSHTYADDLDIVLVSPSGKAVMLMSDCGGPNAISNLTLTFSDSAGGSLSDAGLIFNGTYKPSNYSSTPSDSFPFPAPAGAASAGTSLSVNTGDDPNGKWQLFIVDDTNDAKTGAMTTWHMHFVEPAPPANDDFAAPLALSSSLPQSLSGTCFGATAETGEPTHADYDTPDFSVWYSWTAPADGEVVAETSAVTFNTVLGVYTGSAVAALTEVAFNNEKPAQVAHESGLIFAATAGTTYYLKVDGYDGYSVGTFDLGLRAPSAPTIAASASDSGTVDVAFTHAVSALEYPTSYAATGLPPGLTIDTASGVISGTPTTIGVYPVAVHVANSAGSADQTLTITITAPPAITSVLYASGLVSQPFSYAITATNSPISYAIAPTWDTLPAGLSLDGGTGVISGTPTGTGFYWFDIRATNADGTGKAKLQVWINDASAPHIVDPPSVVGMVGVAFRFILDGTNSPYSYDAFGLPPGLELDADGHHDSLISGKPTEAGTWHVTVLIGNGSGTAVQDLVVTILPTSTATSGGDNTTGDCGLGSPAVVLALVALAGWRRRRLG